MCDSARPSHDSKDYKVEMEEGVARSCSYLRSQEERDI